MHLYLISCHQSTCTRGVNPHAFIYSKNFYVIKVHVQKGCTSLQSYIKAAQGVLPGNGGGLLLKLDFMTLISKK